MANTHRTAGHNWEREVRNDLLPFFPDCYTSRYASRLEDDNKVDLVNTGAFAFQLKAMAKQPSFLPILEEIITGDKKIKTVVYKKRNHRKSQAKLVVFEEKSLLKNKKLTLKFINKLNMVELESNKQPDFVDIFVKEKRNDLCIRFTNKVKQRSFFIILYDYFLTLL